MIRAFRSEVLTALAQIDVAVLTEFRVEGLPVVSASDPGWRWLGNAPKGPSSEGIAALQAAQAEHGLDRVTTGNAQPIHPDDIGIYVRVPNQRNRTPASGEAT